MQGGGGGVVIPLVTLCWVSCDGLASHPVGSSNTFSCLVVWATCGLCAALP